MSSFKQYSPPSDIFALGVSLLCAFSLIKSPGGRAKDLCPVPPEIPEEKKKLGRILPFVYPPPSTSQQPVVIENELAGDDKVDESTRLSIYADYDPRDIANYTQPATPDAKSLKDDLSALCCRMLVSV